MFLKKISLTCKGFLNVLDIKEFNHVVEQPLFEFVEYIVSNRIFVQKEGRPLMSALENKAVSTVRFGLWVALSLISEAGFA